MSEHRPPPDLTTSLEHEDGRRILRVNGEVDLVNAHELAAAMASAADGEGELVVDLREVPFMDSTGLKVILIASRDLTSSLAVVCSSGSAVRRLLDLAGVADRVPSFESEEEALDAIGPTGPRSAA